MWVPRMILVTRSLPKSVKNFVQHLTPTPHRSIMAARALALIVLQLSAYGSYAAECTPEDSKKMWDCSGKISAECNARKVAAGAKGTTIFLDSMAPMLANVALLALRRCVQPQPSHAQTQVSQERQQPTGRVDVQTVGARR